jgi:hypothetical protein
MRNEARSQKHDYSGAEPLTLRDFLSIPYTLESKAVENDAGVWIRRVSYPELPNCSAEAIILEDAIRQLERRRIEIILHMLRQGETPPCPRPPIPGCDPEWVAVEVGLGTAISGLIDRPSTEIRNMADPLAVKRDAQSFAQMKG